MNRLDGKVAFLSGAARGIGGATAKLMASVGAKIAIGDVLDERGRQTAKEIEAAGGQALYVSLDVTQEGSWAAALDATVKKFGKVDVLVNNAGVFTAKPFIEFTTEEIEEQISTNLKGMLYASQEAAKHMSKRKQGKIINITASLALQPDVRIPALLAVALKGGNNQATRALALELAPYGVTVNAVAPGVVDTPMHAPETHAALGSLHPLGRIAAISEISAAVLYLSKADFVSGTVLPVDGGFSAGR
jgi:NAD(P)-dependent dehydrogenase (short-subunit alcohol dehydrogenase family)